MRRNIESSDLDIQNDIPNFQESNEAADSEKVLQEKTCNKVILKCTK